MTTPSNNPSLITLKRKKRDEEGPDTLVIEAQGTDEAAENVYYVKRNKRRDASGIKGSVVRTEEGRFEQPPIEQPRKQYVLQRDTKERKRKRGGEEESLATFVELGTNVQRNATGATGSRQILPQQEQNVEVQDRPFKKPNRQARPATARKTVMKPETEAERLEKEKLAAYLQETVLDEVKRETRPVSKVTGPKISGQRAKELHRQRVEKNKVAAAHHEDVEMSDGDYVYDTYVLASSPSQATMLSPEDMQSLGYLIITPEDQDLWETYLLDEMASDADADSDEEDENAEDYYGADYPEDELSEEDELGRGAYNYRRGADESDGDEFDEDEAAWSDDGGSGDEFEKMMNPFQNMNGVKGLRKGH